MGEKLEKLESQKYCPVLQGSSSSWKQFRIELLADQYAVRASAQPQSSYCESTPSHGAWASQRGLLQSYILGAGSAERHTLCTGALPSSVIARDRRR